MVKLQVIGNYTTTDVKLSEYELSLIRRAKYYSEESSKLVNSVVLRNKNFDKNNPDWGAANAAVHEYVHSYSTPGLKVKIIYE